MSYFPTTHWSLVMNAGHGSVETAQVALGELCRAYWYPLYSYSRSLGDNPHDAEDLIQEFFAELVAQNLVAKAAQDKGCFRSFLLECFKRRRLKQRDKFNAKKRGGGTQLLSWDELAAEERFGSEPQDSVTPEARFERNWAISVLDQAHTRLAAEYAKAGKQDLFNRLRGLLQSARDQSGLAAIAAELGKTEAAIKMEVSRMRARYRELLKEVVGDTVNDPREVEDELRHLLTVLSG